MRQAVNVCICVTMILAKDTVLIAQGFVIQINAKIMFRNNVT